MDPQTPYKLSKTHRIPAGPAKTATPLTKPPPEYITIVYYSVGTIKSSAHIFHNFFKVDPLTLRTS